MKMLYKIICTIIVCLLTLSLKAQNFQWVQQAGNNNGVQWQFSTKICIDSSGNSYVAGVFQDSLLFTTDTLVSASPNKLSLFIVKYDNTGALQWAKKADESANNCSGCLQVTDMVSDAASNIYVTGQFTDTAYFDNDTLINFNSSVKDNFFIGKYNTSGNLVWIKKAVNQPISESTGYGICLDNLGNVYVSGDIRNIVTFDTIQLNTVAGLFSSFIVKYDTSGAVKWAKIINCDTLHQNYNSGMDADASGNVYITGDFTGTMIFDAAVSLVAVNTRTEIYLAKYDSMGTFIWARRAGDIKNDFAKDICVDAMGNSYITGVFDSIIAIGSANLISYGKRDMFVARYNTSGTFQWAHNAGDSLDNIWPYIAIDNSGNLYLHGYERSGTHFGSNIFQGGGYITMYDPAGINQWIMKVSNRGVNSIVKSPAGDFYITGSFDSTYSFGNIILTAHHIYSEDIFTAKLSYSTGLGSMVSANNQIVLFPNPTQGIVNFKGNISGESTITITNTLGQIVYCTKINAQKQMAINVSGLPQGMYFLNVRQLESTSVCRFVKE